MESPGDSGLFRQLGAEQPRHQDNQSPRRLLSRDLWRRTVVLIDKILKGANPAGIPVEEPTKFGLVINLKTAKALALLFRHRYWLSPTK